MSDLEIRPLKRKLKPKESSLSEIIKRLERIEEKLDALSRLLEAQAAVEKTTSIGL